MKKEILLCKEKEILHCEETGRTIPSGCLLAGQHPGARIVHTFRNDVIEVIPLVERDERQRGKREGGMNIFQATSAVDGPTNKHAGAGFTVGKFICSLSPETVNAYLKRHVQRRRGFCGQ